MDHNKLELNLDAQNVRHKRVFLKSLFFSRTLFRLVLDLKGLLRRKPGRRVFLEEPITVEDPFRKLIKQVVAISVSIFILASIAPHSVLETGFTADAFSEGDDYIEEEDLADLPPFLIDQEGYVIKTAPESEEVSRIGLTDSVMHTVVEGENLSSVAALYGISVKTLLWENNLEETSTIKIGQVLVVPAVDGVSYVVAANNETLSGIAKSYGVEEALIKEHNSLEGDVIYKGQKLFIPGGKKKFPDVALRGTGKRGAGRSAYDTFDSKIVVSSDATPVEGKEMIFPTDGKITQGFRGGHYGVDIANAGKPDIWAAADGIVVKVVGGCTPRDVKPDRRCGGGYGNNVVVDHGDGLQTLYGHMETIYVNEGQMVGAGQALGKMGNTGRVYGATGIHLHFEVIDNGVKKNPENYY